MERVIYEKNPLIEVIIQFRFPRILALSSNDPVEYQEAIKDEYPIYQLTLENQQEISISINPNISAVVAPSIVQKQPVRNHMFISRDGKYKINLTNEFISISTLAYYRWEEMISRLERPLAAFENLYNPPFYERIGLRYIDAFSRNDLEIGDRPWNELIQPTWLGAFAYTEEERVINSGLDVEYYLDQKNARAKIHAGLGTINGNSEKVYIIDSDFIKIAMINTNDSYQELEYLHKNAKKFISEVIKDELHLAMKPEKIE